MSFIRIKLQAKETPVYLLYITFLVLPFSNALVSIAIGLLLTSSILFGKYENWKTVFSHSRGILLPLIIIYLLLTISLIWTEKSELGIGSLQRRISFLLIPLILPLYKFDKRHIRVGLTLFSSVILILSIISVFSSFYSFELIRQRQYFDVHRSYMSMYVAISSLFLLKERSKTYDKNKIILINLALVLYAMFAYIMISKVGVISLVLLYIFYFELYKKIKTYISIVILLGSVITLNSITDLHLANRFTQLYKELRRTYRTLNNPNTKEIWHELGSTGHRVLLYKSSVDLVMNSPFYGYGVGSTTREIKRQNWKNGYMRLGERYNLNAHNDFLQLALEMGILGLFLLAALYINLIFGSVRKKQMMFSYIFAIFLLNSFFESILVRQAGIIIFSLLVTLYSIVSFLNSKN